MEWQALTLPHFILSIRDSLLSSGTESESLSGLSGVGHRLEGNEREYQHRGKDDPCGNHRLRDEFIAGADVLEYAGQHEHKESVFEQFEGCSISEMRSDFHFLL